MSENYFINLRVPKKLGNIIIKKQKEKYIIHLSEYTRKFFYNFNKKVHNVNSEMIKEIKELDNLNNILHSNNTIKISLSLYPKDKIVLEKISIDYNIEFSKLLRCIFYLIYYFSIEKLKEEIKDKNDKKVVEVVEVEKVDNSDMTLNLANIENNKPMINNSNTQLTEVFNAVNNSIDNNKKIKISIEIN